MSRLSRAILLCSLILAAAPLAGGAPPTKPRPASGIAVVFLSPLVPERSADLGRIPVYRRPGIGPIGTMSAQKLPGLAPVLTGTEGTVALAVLARKGNWLKIAYDDAGDEGWIAPARSWRQVAWEKLLPDREARLLPGLKKWWYLLREQPVPTARETAAFTRETRFRIEVVAGEWLRVASGADSGWLRWRDEDGRCLIAIEGRIGP